MTTGLSTSEAYCQALEVASRVRREVRRWPFYDRDVLGKQFERSANSVAANFAEAYGRSSPGDKRRFIEFALGSARETQAWLDISARQGLIDSDAEQQLRRLVVSVTRKMNAYRAALARHRKR